MCACAPSEPPRNPNDVWQRGERTSKKTLRIAALGMAGGLAASGFGGATMAVGKAIGGDQGQVSFWVGVGTLGVGVVSSFVSAVVLAVAGIEYATGD